jgi:hypothetical protein
MTDELHGTIAECVIELVVYPNGATRRTKVIEWRDCPPAIWNQVLSWFLTDTVKPTPPDTL